MGYSKISEVEVFNFMSFRHARVVFDDSNILNLKGYNDSGKSALLRAVEVCLADMYKRAQGKYIRYGSEYFRVVVTFDDGVSILRDKYLNGQSLYEMYKDGSVVYTTKQGSRLTRVEGVPETIREYLGLCVTENGCLNFQNCSDRLLLVETSGSENYQELNSVLKSNEISRATALINSDRNAMNQRMIEMENEYNSNEAVLKSRSDVDETIIALVAERDEFSELLQNMDNGITGISNLLEDRSKVPEIPVLNEVDCSKLLMLEEMISDIEKLDSYVELPDVRKIDYVGRLEAVSSLYRMVSWFEGYEELPEVRKVGYERFKDIEIILDAVGRVSESSVDDIPEIQEIGRGYSERLGALSGVYKLLNGLEKCRVAVDGLNSEYEKGQSEVESVMQEAKEQGMELFVCPNCGTCSEVPHVH